MRKRSLGKGRLEVSCIGYGAMPLSLEGRPDRPTATAVIQGAIDLGISLIDTADVYRLPEETENHNEILVAEALEALGSRASHVVVATKGGMIRTSGRWEIDGSAKRIEDSIRRSHAALGGRRPIPLWQHHWPDPRHSITESLVPVRRAVEAGVVDCVGVGNYTVAQIEEAFEVVDVVSVQSQYNLWHREVEHNGVLDFCTSRGLVFLPWRPLGSKWLAGRLGEVDVLAAIASRHGVSECAVVLAWQMKRYTCILPIPGSRDPGHIRECAAALDIDLDQAEIDRISALRPQDLPRRPNAPAWQPTPPLAEPW